MNSYNIIYLFETETRVQCEMLGFVSKAATAFVANAAGDLNAVGWSPQCPKCNFRTHRSQSLKTWPDQLASSAPVRAAQVTVHDRTAPTCMLLCPGCGRVRECRNLLPLFLTPYTNVGLHIILWLIV